MILPHLVEVPVERAEHVLGVLHSKRLHALEVLEVLSRHPAAEEGLDLGGHVVVVQRDPFNSCCQTLEKYLHFVFIL